MKEQNCREKFDANSHLYKKSRNPTNGELTPRDTAEYLIPYEKIVKDSMATTSFNKGTLMFHETKTFTDDRDNSTMGVTKSAVNDVKSIESIRRRKEEIDHEIAQMKKVALYKQYLLLQNKMP